MRKLIAVLVFGVISVSCAHQDPSAGNPLVLLATSVAVREIRSDPTVPATDKALARDALYKTAYEYGRATGLKRRAARELARAFADDVALPDLKCADYAAPPPGCEEAPAGER